MIKYFVYFISIFYLFLYCSPLAENKTEIRYSTFKMEIVSPDSLAQELDFKIPENDVFGGWVVDSSTTIYMVDYLSTKGPFIFISIPGTQTGKYAWNADNDLFNVHIDLDINSFEYYLSSTGFTEITQFEDIDGYIKGIFEGTFISRENLSGEKIQINGTFEVIRLKDNRIVSL